MSDLMTEDQWNTFFSELEGPNGCDFKSDPEDPENPSKITWRCKGGMDKTYAEAILARMEVSDQTQAEVLHHVENLGGHCDCEILFNAAERIYEEIDSMKTLGGKS